MADGEERLKGRNGMAQWSWEKGREGKPGSEERTGGTDKGKEERTGGAERIGSGKDGRRGRKEKAEGKDGSEGWRGMTEGKGRAGRKRRVEGIDRRDGWLNGRRGMERAGNAEVRECWEKTASFWLVFTDQIRKHTESRGVEIRSALLWPARDTRSLAVVADQSWKGRGDGVTREGRKGSKGRGRKGRAGRVRGRAVA